VNDDDDEKVKTVVSDRDFKWEYMSNYRGQRGPFTGGFGSQAAAKDTIYTLKISIHF
jgi:hypothetical protein